MKRSALIALVALIFTCACMLCACDGAQPEAAQPEEDPLPSAETVKLLEDISRGKYPLPTIPEGTLGPVKAVNYYKGVHHAMLKFADVEEPLEIEIYSNTAPLTAQKFCSLVESGYYDGKPLYLIMDDMFCRFGSEAPDEANFVSGEFEEAGIDNSNSLKKGALAFSRSADGRESDPASIIVFLSDMSYLDGKYAAFGKVTKGLSTISHYCDLTHEDAEEGERIVTSESGFITDEEKQPVIESIEMED